MTDYKDVFEARLREAYYRGFKEGCESEREKCEAELSNIFSPTIDGVLVKKKPSKQSESIKNRLIVMQENPDDKRHGTYTGYLYGCRCDGCKKANSNRDRMKYQKKKIKKAAEKLIEVPSDDV